MCAWLFQHVKDLRSHSGFIVELKILGSRYVAWFNWYRNQFRLVVIDLDVEHHFDMRSKKSCDLRIEISTCDAYCSHLVSV